MALKESNKNRKKTTAVEATVEPLANRMEGVFMQASEWTHPGRFYAVPGATESKSGIGSFLKWNLPTVVCVALVALLIFI